jgi:hypothetical protein
MGKEICQKCNNQFSLKAGNYKKHVLSCNGNYIKFEKRNFCKFCNKDFSTMNTSERANHTRWCDKNPKKPEYVSRASEKRKLENYKNTNRQNQFTKAKKEGRKIESKSKGKPNLHWKGRTHSESSKQKISQKALASSHRRLRKGVIQYNGILLDSSWELELAKRLDFLKISWIRPDPIPWIDEQGVKHNYFPDFYLPEHKIFLDPKNPQALKVQIKKIETILSQYNNIIIIESLEKCKNFSL